MKRSELKQIIHEIIEEGRGDRSMKMDRRNAQKKKKERELRKMTEKGLIRFAVDNNLATAITSNHGGDTKEYLIQSILNDNDPKDLDDAFKKSDLEFDDMVV